MPTCEHFIHKFSCDFAKPETRQNQRGQVDIRSLHARVAWVTRRGRTADNPVNGFSSLVDIRAAVDARNETVKHMFLFL